jgi:hypothetical protein
MSSALRRFSIRNSEAQIRTIDKPPQLVPNVERMIVARIEKLEEAARDPSGERVRVEAQDLIGTVTLIEEGEHIIAEIDGVRLWMAGGTPDVTHGAQEAVCAIPTVPQRVRVK